MGTATPIGTPPISGAKMMHKKGMAILLKAAADPNYRDKYEYTALERASGS